MSTETQKDRERQNREKGVFFPFTDFCEKVLSEFIEEARKEYFQEKNNKNEKESM
jgi:hypothetical protein